MTESCFTGTTYVHRRILAANLIGFHDERSKLSDKICVCTNRVFVPGVHANPQRSEMEMEMEKKKQRTFDNNFIERKDFIRRYQR